MASLLDRDDVELLLRELAQRLHAVGITAGIRVIGGAAIALINSDRRSTADIDAVLLPAHPVRVMAEGMALEHDLPADWLNDAALAYVPLVGIDDWQEIFRVGDVTVSIGSVHLLLAMKLRANRGRRDTDDIEFLLDRCGVTSIQDAQEIYERYNTEEVLTDAAATRVQAWLDAR